MIVPPSRPKITAGRWTTALPALILVILSLASGCGGGDKKPDPVLITEANKRAAQGSGYFEKGCFTLAERYFLEALKINRLSDNLPGLVRARNNLGATTMALGKFDEAAEHLNKALELNQLLKSPEETANICGNLGLLNFRVGRYEDAQAWWDKAVQTAENLEGQPGLVTHLTSLGMFHLNQGRLDQAAEALNRAAALAEETKQPLPANTLYQIGLLAQAQGDLTLAEQHLTQAYEADKEIENPRGLAQDLEKLGLLHQQMGKWPEAAFELERAFLLYHTLENREKMKTLYPALEKNQTQIGQPESMTPYKRALESPPPKGRSILCR